MGQFYNEIPESLIPWIQTQHMFWVASAPLDGNGHVNISPKGFEGTFHILDSHTVWYEDLTGSTSETVSHLRENGRITLLFSAFQGPPRIARLYGRGTVYEYGTPQYHEFIPEGTRQPGSRAVIFVDVYKVGTNCGYAVPLFAFQSHRTQLHDWATKKESVDNEADTRGHRDQMQHVLSVAPATSQFTPAPAPIINSSAHSIAPPATSADDEDGIVPTLSVPSAVNLPFSSEVTRVTNEMSGVEPRSYIADGGLRAFWKEKNLKSLDGLPGLRTAHLVPGEFKASNAYTSAVYRAGGHSSGKISSTSRRITTSPTGSGSNYVRNPQHLSVSMPIAAAPSEELRTASIARFGESHRNKSTPLSTSSLSSSMSKTLSPSTSLGSIVAAMIGVLLGDTKHDQARRRVRVEATLASEDFKRVAAFMMGILMTICLQRLVCFGEHFVHSIIPRVDFMDLASTTAMVAVNSTWTSAALSSSGQVLRIIP